MHGSRQQLLPIRKLTALTAAWLLLACAVLLGFSSDASALPWDKDMFSQKSLKANEIARAPVSGTVPRGYTPFKPKNIVEAEKMLQNPTPFGKDTVWRGRRLWSINCATCHGIKGDGTGPVGPQIGAPNITVDSYKAKGDGSIFGIIRLGGSKMPVYGYKLSESEQWDLVNYVRFLQGQEAEGIPRP